MSTTTKVPTLTLANVTSPEKIAQAVNAGTESASRNESTQGQVAVFLYAAVMFGENVTASELADTYGAKKSAISKAGKVVRHYVADMFPDTSETFTMADYVAVVDRIASEWPSVFAAYKGLWPTVRVEKTLADELTRLYRKSGMDAETWGLFCLGVAETADLAGSDDDADDADQ